MHAETGQPSAISSLYFMKRKEENYVKAPVGVPNTSSWDWLPWDFHWSIFGFWTTSWNALYSIIEVLSVGGGKFLQFLQTSATL